jgi:parallel beta-helix repeat protein
VLIQGNESYGNGEHGIYDSNTTHFSVVRDNLIHDNRDCGIHFNGDLSQGGEGLASNALIEGNTIYNNGVGGGSAIDLDGAQNSVIQNNLLYNNHASGISLFKIDAADGSKNNVVVNNTISMAPDGRWALNIQDGSTGNTVRNNILWNNHPWHGSISISNDSLPGFSSDYNVVMNRFTQDDENTVENLQQWQAATGQDQHSLVATPDTLFENGGANNDFRLAANSPAAGAGTNQFAPATDINGTSRQNGNGIDIGAFAAVPATTTPPPVTLPPVTPPVDQPPVTPPVDQPPVTPPPVTSPPVTPPPGDQPPVDQPPVNQPPVTPPPVTLPPVTPPVKQPPVPLPPVTPPPVTPPVHGTPVILDNGHPGYAETGKTWHTQHGGFGGNERSAPAGTGADAALWQAASLTPGNYTVQATWTANAHNASNATYRIYDGDTLVATVTVNQRHQPKGTHVHGVTFQKLATVQVSSGHLRVVLTDNADGTVIADAVRLVPA